MTFEEEEQERRLDDLFNYLVDEGALELLSIDPVTEEPLYRVTQKCKEILPEMYESFKEEMDNAIFDLWQREIIEFKFGEESDTDAVRMTGQGYLNYLKQADELSEEQRRFVTGLIDEAELLASLESSSLRLDEDQE
jgi:hypothetical protein